jgi:hypothetical protein
MRSHPPGRKSQVDLSNPTSSKLVQCYRILVIGNTNRDAWGLGGNNGSRAIGVDPFESGSNLTVIPRLTSYTASTGTAKSFKLI